MLTKIRRRRYIDETVEVEIEFPIYFSYCDDGDHPSDYEAKVCILESGWQTTVTKYTTDWGNEVSHWTIEVRRDKLSELLSASPQGGATSSYPSSRDGFNKFFEQAMAAVREAGE